MLPIAANITMQSTTPTTAPSPQPQAAKPQPPTMNGDAMPTPPPAVDEKKESPSADGYIHEPQMHPVTAVAINGGMPPQQVYVNTAMGHLPALEQQFQSLGLNESPDVGQHTAEGPDNDEEDNEADPVKLFVGQVRIMTIVHT